MSQQTGGYIKKNANKHDNKTTLSQSEFNNNWIEIESCLWQRFWCFLMKARLNGCRNMISVIAVTCFHVVSTSSLFFFCLLFNICSGFSLFQLHERSRCAWRVSTVSSDMKLCNAAFTCTPPYSSLIVVQCTFDPHGDGSIQTSEATISPCLSGTETMLALKKWSHSQIGIELMIFVAIFLFEYARWIHTYKFKT